jgi:hypothetical protein
MNCLEKDVTPVMLAGIIVGWNHVPELEYNRSRDTWTAKPWHCPDYTDKKLIKQIREDLANGIKLKKSMDYIKYDHETGDMLPMNAKAKSPKVSKNGQTSLF